MPHISPVNRKGRRLFRPIAASALLLALGLAVAGSVAGFVGEIGTGGTSPLWVLDLSSGAQMVAVIVIFVTGMLVGRQLRGVYAGSGGDPPRLS